MRGEPVTVPAGDRASAEATSESRVVNPKSNSDFQVIVSHPARQGCIYQIPLAIQRQGIPVKFLTGLYYKPEQFPYSLVKYLPTGKRVGMEYKLEKRRLAGLRPESVSSLGGPWLETILRPLALHDAWQRAHDWLASQWIRRLPPIGKPTLLHCFDGSARRTLGAAKRKGITTVYEITLPAIEGSLVAEERSRLGLSRDSYRSWEGRVAHLIEEYRAADYLIAQSTLTVNYLLQLGVPTKRIVLLPLGVDIERFQPAVIKDTARPFRALFVGQLGIRKGLHHLLEAWQQLDLPNAELVLAGTVDKRQLGVELLEKYRGVYRWLGFVDAQLPSVYQDSDIVILPSLAEGTAMVMHEALASGLPCVISANVGCVVRDGIEGFIVPVGDVEMLKEQIARLYLNSELRRAVGAAARARAEQFSWQGYSRRLALMYRTILSGERESALDILDMRER